MHKERLLLIFLPLILLIPYKFLGQELGSLLVLVLGIIYIFIYIKEIKVNMIYIATLLLLIAAGFLSLFFSQNYTRTISGVLIYVTLLIIYIIFSSSKLDKEKTIKCVVYTTIIASNIFTIWQGFVYKLRIDGNIGYANTYALILFICICLLKVIETNTHFKDYLEFSAMLALIYTGSRTTLIYFLVFLIYSTIVELRNRKSITLLFNFIIALFVYLAISHFGFGMFFVVPIIVYSLYYFTNGVNYKAKNIVILSMTALGLLMLIFVSTNLSRRIANVSINAGVLQERLVYFQDSIKHIARNPLGSGVNTFEYKQYKDQSAFYDVRYIHNSLLQSGYDMGVLGIVAFLFWIFYGLRVILNSNSKYKRLNVFIYVIIFIHSLLDFDFSYIPVLLLVILMVVFSDKEEKLSTYRTKQYILIPTFIIAIYFTIINSNYFIGDEFIAFNNFKGARAVYNINAAITVKDPDAYSRLAEVYNGEYKLTKANSYLQKALDNLNIANGINPNDPRIIGNIAFTYENMGKDKDSIRCYDRFLENIPFYAGMYEAYYSYLERIYSKTKDSYYSSKIDGLKKYYEENGKKLNSKAIYMKNQIKGDLSTWTSDDV